MLNGVSCSCKLIDTLKIRHSGTNVRIGGKSLPATSCEKVGTQVGSAIAAEFGKGTWVVLGYPKKIYRVAFFAKASLAGLTPHKSASCAPV